jgi:glutamate synthase domain-containing protein 2
MLRFLPFAAAVGLAVLFGGLVAAGQSGLLWPFLASALLAVVGVYDLVQRRHSVLRNYPLIGHLRWFFEEIRPEFRQYFLAGDLEERPFNREQRALAYQRAKDVEDRQPYGTRLDVYAANYAWINHSIAPKKVAEESLRVVIGNEQCRRPYSASLLNVSAMSFGALSGAAIRALNRGARLGNFAHDTGEGGISRYHKAEGGALVWELGTGYFGARTKDGAFSPELFQEQASAEQVKMIAIKLSQGAKPGHGGILPGVKVSPEIAEARGVPVGQTVISPPRHTAFSTPLEMMQFIAKLREMCGGKPVGFKLCVGNVWEFMALAKAMCQTGIYPDFVTVDGAEGGTGAGPVEFSNHIGFPALEGLAIVRNTLVGAGLREHVKIAAAGKIISAFDMIRFLARGADFCNAARGFMFALGCLQSYACHTNRCPVGVATTDPRRTRALDVADKGVRVYNYHRNTMKSLAEVLAAAGLTSAHGLRTHHFYARDGEGVARNVHESSTWLEPGELLDGASEPYYAANWKAAQAESFEPRS